MGAPLRSRLQMDQRRAQLIEHGLLLFGSTPYDDVSIDAIAERANVSKGLLYHYFGGKRAFFIEVVRHAARELLAATEPDPALPPLMRGLTGVNNYLDFFERGAPQYGALVSGGIGADPEVAAIIEHARMAFVGRIMLELGLNEPRPVFRTALRGWVGGVEATTQHWLARRDVPRATIVQLILMSMHATLRSAVAMDPSADVTLDDFAVPDLEAFVAANTAARNDRRQ